MNGHEKLFFDFWGESSTDDNLLKEPIFNKISDLLNIRDDVAAAKADWGGNY